MNFTYHLPTLGYSSSEEEENEDSLTCNNKDKYE